MIPVFNRPQPPRPRPVAYADLVRAHPALLGYFRLGETSGTAAADETGGPGGTYAPNAAGTWTGGTLEAGSLIHPFDATNAAAQFSGGYVDLGNNYGTAGNFTVEAWVNSPTYNTAFQQVVSKSGGTGADENYELRFNDTTGRPQFLAVIGGVLRSITATNALIDDATYHLAVTYDGTALNLYVNGIPDAAPVACSGAVTTNANKAAIGARRLSAPQFPFAGVIDEVAIYAAALSASEIAARTFKGFNG